MMCFRNAPLLMPSLRRLKKYGHQRETYHLDQGDRERHYRRRGQIHPRRLRLPALPPPGPVPVSPRRVPRRQADQGGIFPRDGANAEERVSAILGEEKGGK